MRLFSNRSRPVHLGAFPLERLARRVDLPDLTRVAPMRALSFAHSDPLLSRTLSDLVRLT